MHPHNASKWQTIDWKLPKTEGIKEINILHCFNFIEDGKIQGFNNTDTSRTNSNPRIFKTNNIFNFSQPIAATIQSMLGLSCFKNNNVEPLKQLTTNFQTTTLPYLEATYGNHIPKPARQIICSFCKQLGHNKLSKKCPGPSNS